MLAAKEFDSLREHYTMNTESPAPPSEQALENFRLGSHFVSHVFTVPIVGVGNKRRTKNGPCMVVP